MIFNALVLRVTKEYMQREQKSFSLLLIKYLYSKNDFLAGELDPLYSIYIIHIRHTCMLCNVHRPL